MADVAAAAAPLIAAETADGLGVQPARPIRRPHQRAGQHSGEAEAVRELLVLDELLGLDPALDRVVAQRRPQVLGDGDDVAARVDADRVSAVRTSSGVSPMPRMRLDLVTRP